MPPSWSTEQLNLIDKSPELEIATHRTDGTLRQLTPIWVVRVESEVFVRTWYRRDTGWFGRAVAQREAQVRLPGLIIEVEVEDVGNGSPELRSRVDAAYRSKYGRLGHQSMVSDEAAGTTLRLSCR